ncbi:MAG: hypothetical protein V1856_01745 [Candidatus Liptonbacteria bacterium]
MFDCYYLASQAALAAGGRPKLMERQVGLEQAVETIGLCLARASGRLFAFVANPEKPLLERQEEMASILEQMLAISPLIGKFTATTEDVERVAADLAQDTAAALRPRCLAQPSVEVAR